jgi:hypothetical protein
MSKSRGVVAVEFTIDVEEGCDPLDISIGIGDAVARAIRDCSGSAVLIRRFEIEDYE